MATQLGPTRHDRPTIRPVEDDQFGIDVRWGGAAGNRRATVGPMRGADVASVIDEFVW
jgi:hypothetical protein